MATLQLFAYQPYLHANSESTNRLHVRSSSQAQFPPLGTATASGQKNTAAQGHYFRLHVFTKPARACTPAAKCVSFPESKSSGNETEWRDTPPFSWQPCGCARRDHCLVQCWWCAQFMSLLASWMILFKLRCVFDPSPRGKVLHAQIIMSAIVGNPVGYHELHVSSVMPGVSYNM